MGVGASGRYGDDPALARATRRAVVSVAGAVLLLVLGLTVVVFVVAVKFLHALPFQAVGATHGLVLLVPFTLALLWLVRDVRRSARGRFLSRWDAGDYVTDHPAAVALARLAALADVATPRLRLVTSDVPNSYAVVEIDGETTVCVTTGALARCTPAELDAMLAHELFHVARGDALLMSRLEAVAELADRHVDLLAHRIVPPVRTLMRQRELAADRAAALLTGRPSDLDAALRRCDPNGHGAGPADLRLIVGVPFVESRPYGPPERRTHPTVDERADNLAKVAAQLGHR